MCGITGHITPFHSSGIEDRVKSAMRKMGHRGPDDKGFDIIRVGELTHYAGHRRLSIIDLSESGRQPMLSDDGNFSISFNGEIYNYKELRTELESLGYSFETDTDTEVLLQAWRCWGEAVVRKITGMFAFVITDRRSDTIWCVRDAFGIKPFFYRKTEQSFCYASEIEALLELLPDSPTLSLQQAYDYLVYEEYERDENTFFEGIYRLLPGHLMSIRFSDNKLKCTQKKWWNPSIAVRNDLTFPQAAEELRDRFLHNIRLHLRSDVPLGAALSGGIDSSAVVCGMRHVEPRMDIHTFSFIATGSNLNEERWIQLINEHTGARSSTVSLSYENLRDDLNDIIRVQGEPFRTTNMYAQFKVFQLAREKGVTVLLNGQGADEMLAGYEGYPEQKVETLFHGGNMLRLLTFLLHWPDGQQRKRSRLIRALLKSMLSRRMQHSLRRKRHAGTQISWINKRWLSDRGVVTDGDSVLFTGESDVRRVSEQLREELQKVRIPRLLRYEDRNSMYWSLESRVPFLTTDLAEFLLQMPEEYLISDRGSTKHLFREAMRGIIPEAVLNRTDKIGFDTPGEFWLSDFHQDLDQLLEPLRELPFINYPECHRMVSGILSGRTPFSWQAWRILCFARWKQLYDVSLK